MIRFFDWVKEKGISLIRLQGTYGEFELRCFKSWAVLRQGGGKNGEFCSTPFPSTRTPIPFLLPLHRSIDTRTAPVVHKYIQLWTLRLTISILSRSRVTDTLLWSRSQVTKKPLNNPKRVSRWTKSMHSN